MAITPKPPGSVDAPNDLTPEVAGSVAVPNTLTPEAAGTVAVPNNLAPEAAGSVAIPNDLTAETAGSVAIPNTLTPEAAGSVAVPNTLAPEAAGNVAVPNTLAASDAPAFPRTLCPVVNMGFSDGLYAQDGTPVNESDLITYARGSSATFINRQKASNGSWEYFIDTEATGNVKRVEYDPETGENVGVLLEQATTNLFLYSSSIGTPPWVKTSASSSSNFAEAPNLALEADRLAAAAGTVTPALNQSVTTVAAQKYTVSIFVKMAAASRLQITFAAGNVANDPRVNFNVATGAITAQDSDIEYATIKRLSRDWYRVSATVTAVGTTLDANFVMIAGDSDARNQANAWTSTDDLYLWGAQIENQVTPTSQIETSGSAVSRLADQLSIPNLNNMPLRDVTIHSEVDLIPAGATRFIYVADTNGVGGVFGLVQNSGAIAANHGTAAGVIETFGNYNSRFDMTTVFDFSANTLTGYLDGVQKVSGDAGTIPAIDTAGVFAVGSGTTFTANLNGHIKSLRIFDVVLTSAEVAQL